MASEIEKFLFGCHGTHALISLSLSIDRIVVAVAPWTDLTCIKEAVFERATLLSVCASSSEPPEEFTLPWDIIDFANTRQADGRWKFVLYCGNAVELVFLADFPQSNNSAGAD
ncbi:hypothetical protein H6F43_02240 [Leptolyngbya sp. FACHB-36]|uniref:hypothetical protein n=1 Tax=Leptolyngbya sp. FACHB-36 TaxID=2692808 RepID=UPI001681A7CB|nr:hypothetical protein [Leptolyngbya sp. FACHB-36]MBD2019006.1 hypothetical protein [Leptolyngbya sp. FACHB-36]